MDPHPEVYVPLQFDPNTRDQGDFYKVVGRLKPGVSLEQAKARLKIAASEFRIKFPNALGPTESFTAKTLRESSVDDVRSLLLLLSAAASARGPADRLRQRREPSADARLRPQA